MNKRWLFHRLIIFIVSLCGIFIAASIPSDPNKIASNHTNMIAPPPINPFAHAVSGAAIVEPLGDNFKIGIPFPEIVEEVFVHVWQKVDCGEPLLRIDTRQIRAQIEIDKTNIEVAKAQLDLLEIQYKRYLSIQDKRAISEETITTQKSEIEVAQAELLASKAKLAADQVELERHTILSPINGVVLRNTFHVGEFAGAATSGGLTTTSNTVILNTPFEMIVGYSDELQLRVDIDEQNASRVCPDKKAIGYPRSVVKRRFDLEFVRIEPFVIPKKSLTGESDERVDTRVLQVIYKVKKIPDYPLYVGQQFDVFIEAEPIPAYAPNGEFHL